MQNSLQAVAGGQSEPGIRLPPEASMVVAVLSSLQSNIVKKIIKSQVAYRHYLCFRDHHFSQISKNYKGVSKWTLFHPPNIKKGFHKSFMMYHYIDTSKPEASEVVWWDANIRFQKVETCCRSAWSRRPPSLTQYTTRCLWFTVGSRPGDLAARLEDISDHCTKPGFRGKPTPGAAERRPPCVRAGGGSACARRSRGLLVQGSKTHFVFLVTQDNRYRACTCVLVRQGVSVSAVCNAAPQCHVCHPSPLLSGTLTGRAQRVRRRRAAVLHASANFTLSGSTKPESTRVHPSQMKGH